MDVKEAREKIRVLQQKQQIIDAEICAVILRSKGREFRIIRLDKPVPDSVELEGFEYCGVLGFTAGEAWCQSEATNPEALTVMLYASLAFAQQVAYDMKQRSTDWISRLHSLPDTRTEN